MPRFPVSDHCDGELFFNPHACTDRTLRDLLRWWRTRTAVPWPTAVPVGTPGPLPGVPAGRVAATFIGHSTFLLRTTALSVLTDPVFTRHAGPLGRFGPRRVRPPALSLDQLPAVDVVLVSHNHYDHLQWTSLGEIDRRFGPVLAAPLGLAAFLRRAGLRRVVELDWWERARLERPDRITLVPAQHFSARTPFDRNRTLWGGFVVESGGRTIYVVGDSGYSPQFREIGARFPSIDLALIPIGAYEPRWFMQPVHVNPEEAVRIHLAVGSRGSVAMHYGTFHLTDEGIDEPIERLAQARDAAGLSAGAFRAMGFGETIVV